MTFTLGKGAGGLDIKVHVLASAQGVWDPAGKKIVKIKNEPVDQNDLAQALNDRSGATLH